MAAKHSDTYLKKLAKSKRLESYKRRPARKAAAQRTFVSRANS